MDGWFRYLALKAKARTGFSASLVVWSVIAIIAAAVMVVFLNLAAFVWLAELYGALVASLSMAALYLLIALIAALCIMRTRRRAIESARLQLAARSETSWLDPRLIGIGLQAGRAIGWRRLASLAAVGILAAVLAKEWLGRDEKPLESDGDDEV